MAAERRAHFANGALPWAVVGGRDRFQLVDRFQTQKSGS